ncbi:N-acetyl-alpha-D-glucosaminyl L-malate synthase BshA [Flavobacterium piscinae]|uniref:N-acetyl-alpha-D-glucosaminyl L-malate synthase BshA n=1 Tax=Flavobacterium piscinae TaxID=2506424 RepID=UPI002AABEAB8|nr:N-acetyl-alpha-D-glucosaminyl L-malate synthase BshA [Flavobacterium piscinae]
MKIAIVCYPTFGGSGVVATELGLELAQRGHEIHFITYKQPVRLALLNPNLHYHEVNVPEYPLFHYQPYELALSSKLVDMVKLHKIELLHVHYAIPHAYAGYMAKQMLKAEGIYIPMVTTLHGTDITLVGKHPFYKSAVTFSINQSDVVTSVSQSLKDDTYKHFAITKEIEVIPNFIEINKAKVEEGTPCYRSLMAKNDERIITHISNFRKVKRIPDVIKIFYKIQQQIPAKLMMVGEGPEKENAELLCEELGISNKVIFFETAMKLIKFYVSPICFCFHRKRKVSVWSLEAMACSVPVISTNTGGLPEVNKDGFSGYLSNVGAIDAMAENALKIIQDDVTLSTFKKNAFAVAQQFDIINILPLYEAVYEKAIKNQFNSISS